MSLCVNMGMPTAGQVDGKIGKSAPRRRETENETTDKKGIRELTPSRVLTLSKRIHAKTMLYHRSI